jgi:aldehyde oxidoreductase
MRFRLNGAEVRYEGDPSVSLLRYLRDEAGIQSAKDGCSPQAACGCCAVELNGRVVLSCVIAMEKVDGGEVTTTEGLEEAEARALTDAFEACGAAQCGFCIPGIVMRAARLLRDTPSPTDEEIRTSLNQHLCRCTGYQKIVEAIRVAGESLRTGRPVPEAERSGRVGTRLPKYDVRDVVLGFRPYVADMSLEGMLHGALRLSDHPRARMVRIDASRAAAMEGVERVVLADAVPGARRIGLIVRDWPVLVAEGEVTRCVGDVVACVAARTRAIAREAAAAIDVEYEVLEPVTDVFRAIEPDAPRVHEGGNVLSVSRARKGDADGALARCAHVVEETYETQFIEHAYLEPEAAIAAPEGDGVLVYSQSQGVYEDRRQIAELLGIDEGRVRVELVPNGGGFGGKEDLSVQGHAALMAFVLGRPVKVELSRDESILMHPKRHPLHMRYTLGCDAGGKLLALRARIHGDTGAYASVGAKVLERACGHATGAYDVPNVDVESTAVYTNNVPCGAMRGFGANQAAFAMESAIDELCERGGFDRWQIRWDNALTEGRTTATGQTLASGVGVRATLEAVEDAFRGARYAGIACGLKNTGIGNGMKDDGEAMIVVRAPDVVEVHHGWTEMGQGVHTMAVQTFCEETGLPPDIVRVSVRTDSETPCGMTTASRATSIVGNSVIDACRGLVDDLETHRLAELVGREYRGVWVCDWTTKPGAEDGKPTCTHYSYSYATQVVVLNDEGRLDRVIAAHDAGRVMNPMLFEGQIEGSVHMGLGYALTEELEMEGGRPRSTRLRKCGVLRGAGHAGGRGDRGRGPGRVRPVRGEGRGRDRAGADGAGGGGGAVRVRWRASPEAPDA